MMPQTSEEHTLNPKNLSSNQPLKEPVQRCYVQYFCGHILNYHTAHHTQWLVDSLEKHISRKIRCTYPFYRYDPQNDYSRVMKQFVQKPNLVCIVKLKNGQIVVGYSQPGISEKFRSYSKINYNFPSNAGLLFGLMNQKVFTLKTKHSYKSITPTTYDDFFILWGGGFRIKAGSNQFFSSYGTASCFYEEVGNQSSNFQDLMMLDSQSQDRQTELITYEFFQIQFEDDPILCQTLQSACPQQQQKDQN